METPEQLDSNEVLLMICAQLGKGLNNQVPETPSDYSNVVEQNENRISVKLHDPYDSGADRWFSIEVHPQTVEEVWAEEEPNE